MTKDLQILEEKFKDIKARLGAAISIIDEVERMLLRIKSNGANSSFLDFIESETMRNKEEDKTKILEFLKSDKASGYSESRFSAIATYLFSPEDHAYVDSLLKEMSDSRQIVYRDEYIAINEERRVPEQIDEPIHSNEVRAIKPICVGSRVKSVIFDCLALDLFHEIRDSDLIVEDFGADSIDLAELVMAFEEEFDISIPDEDAEKIKTVGDAVKYVEGRASEEDGIVDTEDAKLVHSVNKAAAKDIQTKKSLNAELILKYLKNKGGRATLKQIQSRFKGYLNNTCGEIKDLVSRETNCILVFSGKLSQCEVVLSDAWNERI
jgi:acyl carrier protein